MKQLLFILSLFFLPLISFGETESTVGEDQLQPGIDILYVIDSSSWILPDGKSADNIEELKAHLEEVAEKRWLDRQMRQMEELIQLLLEESTKESRDFDSVVCNLSTESDVEPDSETEKCKAFKFSESLKTATLAGNNEVRDQILLDCMTKGILWKDCPLPKTNHSLPNSEVERASLFDDVSLFQWPSLSGPSAVELLREEREFQFRQRQQRLEERRLEMEMRRQN